MTRTDLANIIFPNLEHDIDYYNAKYPKRNLTDEQYVTRFAPSPTGYMHIGNFFSALVDYIIAHNTNGIFYLRNEDTDKAREVSDAVEKIMNTLNYYHIKPQEYQAGDVIVGEYGPYIQSERKEIYHAFIKYLIEIGRAYPCFCTKDELDEKRLHQEKAKLRTGYYGGFAKCRQVDVDEAIERIKKGEPYVIRFRSKGIHEKKFIFDDLVKGKIELPENDQDIVIMKSDNLLPTYHFAHLVDDHLMHTTHVVRGEEWLSSVPVHIELFEAFGYEPPKYIHVPLIMKQDGDKKRKISKRKDPEASMSYYEELGYPPLAVIESLMTIINSDYEEWHTANPDKNFLDFTFRPDKMSPSGALYDLEKLNNISKDIISKMTKEKLYELSYNWAKKYSDSLKTLIERDKEYYMDILNIERVQDKPRKDIAYYSQIENLIWYMYDDLFTNNGSYSFKNINNINEIKLILNTYMDKYFDISNKDVWFQKIKDMCDELGYASNMKEYKKNPELFKGNVADVSTVLRICLTKESMTPDMYEIMHLLGKERVFNRYLDFIKGN